MMRRLVKEKLLKFDGRPLFPERIASTVEYELSEDERRLYEAVTDYVREEMNRAERLQTEGEGRRGTIVGFALTILQRRLASSPEAIYRSIDRRRKRLHDRLAQEERRLRDPTTRLEVAEELWKLDEEDLEELDDRPEEEVERLEEAVVDQASAAQTIEELRAEIETLKRLERLALSVRNAGTDRKWEELSKLLQDDRVMVDADGRRRKLIIFTEHRDTLNYLAARIRTLMGRAEAVVTIHGGMRREDRRRAQESFVHDPEAAILVATDAAGEGVNLQRANLLVNYDLPWNPNRIEQRFGRIHRIGQTEVCHMWNLVATDTREGKVFERLFDKLKEQRKALGGQVFDGLGEVFVDQPLRDLLIEAVRYGDRSDVRARLDHVVDAAVGENLKAALRERALLTDVLTPADVEGIREKLEEAEARRLQPHFIRSFFLEAFRLFGGQIARREPGRYEITHVPAEIRQREHAVRAMRPIVRRYERVTFEKELVGPVGQPPAELLAPGHPLMDATVDLALERYRPLLKRGAVLVADADEAEKPRALVYLEDAIQSAARDERGSRRVVSRRIQFVELTEAGGKRPVGYAPYLDYRELRGDESSLVRDLAGQAWLREVESNALDYAIQEAVPEHLEEVRRRTVQRVVKTMAAVKHRLTREIAYWDNRANELKQQELVGKKPKLNSGKARQRADELQARLHRRLKELDQEKQLSPLPPVVIGGALVVPRGLLDRRRGERREDPAAHARETERIERLAVEAVLAAERTIGRQPREMPRNNPGFDVLSRDPITGGIWFIEVKGRVLGAPTVTVTKNEILTGLNKPDRFLLALVAVDGDETEPRYVTRPFKGTEDVYFDAASINFEWDKLWQRGYPPEKTAPLVAPGLETVDLIIPDR
jgi:superfamily II DNA/RNA helicase